MSNLSNKSEHNLDCAEFLHGKNRFTPVPHCSYYSCYQLMKHIWLHKFNKTELDLASEIRKDSNSRTGSHEVLINQIFKLANKTKYDSRTFMNNALQLKRLRTEADYNDNVIDISKSKVALELSKEINKELKKIA